MAAAIPGDCGRGDSQKQGHVWQHISTGPYVSWQQQQVIAGQQMLARELAVLISNDYEAGYPGSTL